MIEITLILHTDTYNIWFLIWIIFTHLLGADSKILNHFRMRFHKSLDHPMRWPYITLSTVQPTVHAECFSPCPSTLAYTPGLLQSANSLQWKCDECQANYMYCTVCTVQVYVVLSIRSNIYSTVVVLGPACVLTDIIRIVFLFILQYVFTSSHYSTGKLTVVMQ